MSTFELEVVGGRYFLRGEEVTEAEAMNYIDSAEKITHLQVEHTNVKPLDISHYTDEDAKAFNDTLTQEEKDAPTYLEWCNETLGRMVKETAKLFDDQQGDHSVCAEGLGILFASKMHDINSAQTKIELNGVSHASTVLGDYTIVCVRTDGDADRAESVEFLKKVASEMETKSSS